MPNSFAHNVLLLYSDKSGIGGSTEKPPGLKFTWLYTNHRFIKNQ